MTIAENILGYGDSDVNADEFSREAPGIDAIWERISGQILSITRSSDGANQPGLSQRATRCLEELQQLPYYDTREYFKPVSAGKCKCINAGGWGFIDIKAGEVYDTDYFITRLRRIASYIGRYDLSHDDEIPASRLIMALSGIIACKTIAEAIPGTGDSDIDSDEFSTVIYGDHDVAVNLPGLLKRMAAVAHSDNPDIAAVQDLVKETRRYYTGTAYNVDNVTPGLAPGTVRLPTWASQLTASECLDNANFVIDLMPRHAHEASFENVRSDIGEIGSFLRGYAVCRTDPRLSQRAS
jgi:hypothetical protein